jgi:hypothetical protein
MRGHYRNSPINWTSGKRERANLEIQARLRDEYRLNHCWPTANPGVPLAQPLRWTSDPSQAHHCDGIFVPAWWSPKLRSCEVISGLEWDGMSDHNPVTAEFDLIKNHEHARCRPPISACAGSPQPRDHLHLERLPLSRIRRLLEIVGMT